MRSAHTPAGIENSRNGSVCAVCKTPVAASPAPSASTATSGAAARPTCSASCAARLDQASRWNAGGSEDFGCGLIVHLFEIDEIAIWRTVVWRALRRLRSNSNDCTRPSARYLSAALRGKRVAVMPASAYLNLAARSGVRALTPALHCPTGDGRSFRRTRRRPQCCLQQQVKTGVRSAS